MLSERDSNKMLVNTNFIRSLREALTYIAVI
jgi:hypothetical protein